MTNFLLAALIQCSPIFWTHPPTYDGQDLLATAGTQCSIASVNHGTMDQLFNYIKLSTEKFADKIHRGPDAGFFAGMRAFQYDLTTTQKHDTQTITIRGEVTIASDMDTFYQGMKSTDVTATGPAKNIKELSGDVTVDKQGDGYEARVTTTIRVTRPKVIPESKFIQIVGKQIDTELRQNAQDILTDFQKVL